MTALIYAAWNGHADAVKLLLKAGASIVAKNQTTKELLRNASADRLRVPEQQRIAAALILAAQYGHANTVNLLLEARADIEAKDTVSIRISICTCVYVYVYVCCILPS